MENTARVAWSVREWGECVSLSSSQIYEMLAAGEIDSVKIGGKRLIVTAPADFIRRRRRLGAGDDEAA